MKRKHARKYDCSFAIQLQQDEGEHFVRVAQVMHVGARVLLTREALAPLQQRPRIARVGGAREIREVSARGEHARHDGRLRCRLVRVAAAAAVVGLEMIAMHVFRLLCWALSGTTSHNM
jgi:hypothetical protein